VGRLASLRTLDLDGCQGLVDACMLRLGPMPLLERLVLARCHFVTDVAVDHVARMAPQLRHVDVSHCFRISDTGFAALAHLPHLAELAARESARLSPRGLNTLARMAPRLQLLDLRMCTEVNHEHMVDMITVMGAALQLLPPPVPPAAAAGAGASASGSQSAPTSPVVPIVGVPLCLQTLRLGYSYTVSDDTLRTLVECAPHLVELDVANCQLMSTAGLASIAQLRRLRRLNVSRCMQVTDAGIAHLAAGCGQLAHLNVAYCEYLTDRVFVHLAALAALCELDISGCWRLTYAGLAPLGARLNSLQIWRGTRPT
jgi:F-box and leucine-rich repeat protein 14